MSAPIDWTAITLSIAAGVVLAIVGVLKTRGGARIHTDGEGPSLDDLLSRRRTLLEALRGAHDTRAVRGAAAMDAEIATLEKEATDTLRAIEARTPASRNPVGVGAAAPAPATLSAARWQGAVGGAAVVAFGAAVVFALQQGVRPRLEGMSPTGGDEDTLARDAARVPAPGEPGGGVPGVPESLQPKPSPALDMARARVLAAPKDVAAHVELGWALLEAEGWIDLFQVAKETLEIQPGQPDALVQTAFVRMVMGQGEEAEALVDQALGAAPTHVEALQAKGTLRMRAGDPTGALPFFERGLATAGPGRGFEGLIDLAKNPKQGMAPGSSAPTGLPHPEGGALPPGHPPAVGGSAVSGGAPTAADRGAPVSGTLTLGRTYDVPAGAVVFLVARAKGQVAGPPIASRRLPAGPFPMAFEIGPDHVMMGGPFPTEVSLMARIDLDANAMSKEPGAPTAAPIDVEAGRGDVDLVLR